ESLGICDLDSGGHDALMAQRSAGATLWDLVHPPGNGDRPWQSSVCDFGHALHSLITCRCRICAGFRVRSRASRASDRLEASDVYLTHSVCHTLCMSYTYSSLLEVEGLSKSYGKQPVLHDLTLSLGPGIHALLGPNG